ncbi:MAG: hypothetical protein ABSD74_08235 [Rhizomicrobium sp.]|jgi:hypothetical protein
MNANAFYADAATVPVSDARPLLICDADEVLLRFADGFDRFLRSRGLYLDFASYRLHGNVRRIGTNDVPLDVEVTALLEEFRAELDGLAAAEDALGVIGGLRPLLDVIVLSNINTSQAPARRRNLDALGLDFPLVVNSGSKGAAVRKLAQRSGKPAFFMDDIPQHHASAAEHAPDVWRIHFVADDRLKPLMPTSPHAHLRAQTWHEAGAFIRHQLKG